MAEPDKKGTFVPNTEPPKTDDAVRARRPGAGASDKATEKGITSLTGKPLQGKALADFKIAFDKSALLRGTYNEDGTMKSDVQSITE